MAKGKHSTAAAGRRAATAEAERDRLKSELKAEQIAHAASVMRLRAEMHDSSVRWMSEFEERLGERMDSEFHERSRATAERLFVEREAEIRRHVAEVVGKWMGRTDVQMTMSAHADLVRDLDLGEQAPQLLHTAADTTGNRHARRMTPKKAKAHAEMLKQADL